MTEVINQNIEPGVHSLHSEEQDSLAGEHRKNMAIDKKEEDVSEIKTDINSSGDVEGLKHTNRGDKSSNTDQQESSKPDVSPRPIKTPRKSLTNLDPEAKDTEQSEMFEEKKSTTSSPEEHPDNTTPVNVTGDTSEENSGKEENNNNEPVRKRVVSDVKKRQLDSRESEDGLSSKGVVPDSHQGKVITKRPSFTGKLTLGQNGSSSPGSSDDGQGSEDNINVVVRVRPLNEKEVDKKDAQSIEFPGDGAIWIENYPGQKKSFTFNVVFECESNQTDVFEHSGIKKLIDMSIKGYSCTTFAYGQTGSGKTHTITGPPEAYLDGAQHEEMWGLIPQSFQFLFDQMEKTRDSTYTILASYLEIYNEQVIDLLNPNQRRRLDVRWSKDKGFHVDNLFYVECESADDLMAVLEEGLRNRQSSSHELNENSSRSHSILSLMIESEIADPDDENLYITKHGKLTFVDLAGSEKIKESGSTGEQLVESNNINKSLLVLGNCISALGDAKKRQGHIPYRDSKLTKLLADSLGGNGVTLMIACVSPYSSNLGESMNTLRYANRAKKIKNKPIVKLDPREKLLHSLKREIKLLRSENQYFRQLHNFPQNKELDDPEYLEMKKVGSRAGKKENGDVKGSGAKATNVQSSPKTGSPATKAPPVRRPLPPREELADNGDLYSMLQEYMVENEVLRHENSDLHFGRDYLRREQQTLSRDNDKLARKLEDLTRIMSRSPSLYSVATSATSQRTYWDPYPFNSYDSTPRDTPPTYSGYPSPLNSGKSPRGWGYHERQNSSGSYGKPAQELPPVELRGGPYMGSPSQASPNGGRRKPPPHPGMKPPHRLAEPVSRPQGYSDKFNQKLEQKNVQEVNSKVSHIPAPQKYKRKQDQPVINNAPRGNIAQPILPQQNQPIHRVPAYNDDVNERLRHELSDLDSQIRSQQKVVQQTKPMAAHNGKR